MPGAQRAAGTVSPSWMSAVSRLGPGGVVARRPLTVQALAGNAAVARLVQGSAGRQVGPMLQGQSGNAAVARLIEGLAGREASPVVQRDFLDDATAAASGLLDKGSTFIDDTISAASGLIGAGPTTDPEGSGGGPEPGGAGGAGPRSSGVPTLRPGDSGPTVSALQARLAALGFDASPTGIFDEATAIAVRAFQGGAGLLADGVVGALTLAGLGKAEAGAGSSAATADIVATKGAKANSGEPGDFCEPFPDRQTAVDTRDGVGAKAFLAATRVFGGAVARLWTDYVNGGRSDVQALTDSSVVQSFSADATTGRAAAKVADRVRATAEEGAGLPDGVHQLSKIISRADRFLIGVNMDFSDPFSIPGNIAGGVSSPPQTSSLIGAKPSPVDDAREISGTATITTQSNGTQFIVVQPHFKVTDTVDFCPGGSGSFLEQQVTIPLSRCEASGVSGDVPFTVDYDAPPEKRGATPPRARDLGEIDVQPLATKEPRKPLPSAQRACCPACASGASCEK